MMTMDHIMTVQLPSYSDEEHREMNPRWKLHSIICFSPLGKVKKERERSIMYFRGTTIRLYNHELNSGSKVTCSQRETKFISLNPGSFCGSQSHLRQGGFEVNTLLARA